MENSRNTVQGKRCGGSESVTLHKKGSLEKDVSICGSPSPFNAGRKQGFGAMIDGAREKGSGRRRIQLARTDEEAEETKVEAVREYSTAGATRAERFQLEEGEGSKREDNIAELEVNERGPADEYSS